MKISASDLKDLNILKHYRIIRKWACKNNDLTDADLEVLIYLDCMDLFSKHDFEQGVYSYSWDNRRWNRLIPTSARRNKLIKGNSYTDKVLTKAIYNVNKDKTR